MCLRAPLQIASPRPYQVSTVDNGSRIYTDSPCVFTNLPPRLRRKTCICPPNADRLIETNALIKFDVSGDAEVIVLYDVSGGDGARLPAWIEDQGFARVRATLKAEGGDMQRGIMFLMLSPPLMM